MPQKALARDLEYPVACDCGKFPSLRSPHTIAAVAFQNPMDRRRHPRVTALLPVRLWGVDAHSQPFTQTASARNISSSGAVIRGISCQILPGAVLEVQFGEDKAQFRVVWAGKAGTRREGEIGIEIVASQPGLWSENMCWYSQTAGVG